VLLQVTFVNGQCRKKYILILKVIGRFCKVGKHLSVGKMQSEPHVTGESSYGESTTVQSTSGSASGTTWADVARGRRPNVDTVDAKMFREVILLKQSS
jgi:hypothetical protein